MSAQAVSLYFAPTLAVNLAMSLHERNVLISVNTTCRARKVNPYIPLSVNTSRTYFGYVCQNFIFSVRIVCLSSLKSQLLLILSICSRHRYIQSLMRFCLKHYLLLSQQKLFQLVICLAILLAVQFLLVYVTFYKKIGERLIYYIAHYKHILLCSLDYLYIFLPVA